MEHPAQPEQPPQHPLPPFPFLVFFRWIIRWITAPATAVRAKTRIPISAGLIAPPPFAENRNRNRGGLFTPAAIPSLSESGLPPLPFGGTG